MLHAIRIAVASSSISTRIDSNMILQISILDMYVCLNLLLCLIHINLQLFIAYILEIANAKSQFHMLILHLKFVSIISFRSLSLNETI